MSATAKFGHNTGCFEWYTPPHVIAAARAVLGGIDLDPASCEVANVVVKATTYYTAELDGLTQTWAGRVWLNPPYAHPLVGQFVDKLLDAYRSGAVPEALVLLNNVTDTAAFQRLAAVAVAWCFPRRRLQFWNPAKGPGHTQQGQVIVYLGPHVERFAAAFESYGQLVTPYRAAPDADVAAPDAVRDGA